MPDLPWPSTWRRRRRDRLKAFAWTALGLVLVGVGLSESARRGVPRAGLIGFGIVLLAVEGPALSTRSARAVPLTETPGVLLPYSRLRSLAMAAGATGMAAVCWTLGADPTALSGMRAFGALGAALFSGAAVLFLAVLVPQRGVALTPDAVVVGHGGAAWVVPWPHVRGIWTYGLAENRGLLVVADDRRNVTATTWWLPRVSWLGRKPKAQIPVVSSVLAVDPVVAHWALRYYYEHPEARAELADGRAVERIARRDLR